MFFKSEAELEKLGAAITTKEIKQQPLLWEETYTLWQKVAPAFEQMMTELLQSTAKKVRVIFTGAGTSQYVGDTLVPYLTRIGATERLEFLSFGTTDIVSAPEDHLLADEPTLLVSFARSGNSPESKATIELAQKIVKDLRNLIITCAPQGDLAKAGQADKQSLVVLMPSASNDQGFAMTGSFTCMLLAGALFFDQTSAYQKEQFVQTAVKLGQMILTKEEELQALVDLDFTRIVYLGSGSLRGLSREAQLKILELTHGQIATVFDSSMGFRHGPKSFVDPKTLVCGFIANDPYTQKYDLDILEELKADQIALAVVALGQEANKFSGQSIVYGEQDLLLPEVYLALPDVLVAQALALLTAVKIGNTPDTPSPSGTVNRVVKGVLLHEYR